MEFDDSVLEQIAKNSKRLTPFKDYTVGMAGYEWSSPKNDAGILVLTDLLLQPSSLKDSRVLILGPGSTLELDEFWRAGAARIVGVDNTNVQTYDYEVHELDDASYEFPTTPNKKARDERWEAFIKRTGFSERDIVSVFTSCSSGKPAQYLSGETKGRLLELRKKVLKVTNDEEYWREVKAHSPQRFALLDKPDYIKKGKNMESVDGRVLYIFGDAQDKLPELKEHFDLVTAVALFEEGLYGPEEKMTEYKMFVSRKAEGRMYEGAEIQRVVQGVARSLVNGGVFLVKTIYNPTFLTPSDFEPHGLRVENHNTKTPYGWFTILRKAA